MYQGLDLFRIFACHGRAQVALLLRCERFLSNPTRAVSRKPRGWQCMSHVLFFLQGEGKPGVGLQFINTFLFSPTPRTTQIVPHGHAADKSGRSTRGIASGSSHIMGKSSHKILNKFLSQPEGPLFLFTPLRLSRTLLPL
jgi:hypothetical protein